jgi:phosphoribosyl 1,2-cyclic phosphate phosphodiesterase
VSLELLFLGTGTSHGVPMIGCGCPVCTSADPRNRRTRTSAAVSDGERTILIDTSPEFRLQAIWTGLPRVDAVLFTHSHADHIFGLDDIRRFNYLQNAEIPCYGSKETLATIRRAFRYVFVATQEGGGKPNVSLNPVSGPFEAAGTVIRPLPILHGDLAISGYRIGRLAYITDCSAIPEPTFELLRDLDVLVLPALRPTPHPTHFSLGQAVEAAQRIGARETYFVHMSHRLEHEETNRSLPVGMQLAYDGQRVEVRE